MVVKTITVNCHIAADEFQTKAIKFEKPVIIYGIDFDQSGDTIFGAADELEWVITTKPITAMVLASDTRTLVKAEHHMVSAVGWHTCPCVSWRLNQGVIVPTGTLYLSVDSNSVGASIMSAKIFYREVRQSSKNRKERLY